MSSERTKFMSLDDKTQLDIITYRLDGSSLQCMVLELSNACKDSVIKEAVAEYHRHNDHPFDDDCCELYKELWTMYCNDEWYGWKH